jgi:hypothetical protein
MARYRPTPTCPYCGVVIAKGIYRDQSKIPFMQRVIGDTFIRWDYIKHSCKGKKEADKKMKEEVDKAWDKIKKGGGKLPPFMKQ